METIRLSFKPYSNRQKPSVPGPTSTTSVGPSTSTVRPSSSRRQTRSTSRHEPVQPEVEPTESRRAGAKRTRRSSVPRVEEVRLEDRQVNDLIRGSASNTIRLDDDSVRRIVQGLIQPVVEDLIEPVTQRLRGYMQELFDTISCRHSRSPPIEPER